MQLTPMLTLFNFGRNKQKGYAKLKPLKHHLIAFVQLRHLIQKYKGLKPVYISVKKKSKEQLIDMCYMCKDMLVLPRHFVDPIIEDDSNIEDVEVNNDSDDTDAEEE